MAPDEILMKVHMKIVFRINFFNEIIEPCKYIVQVTVVKHSKYNMKNNKLVNIL